MLTFTPHHAALHEGLLHAMPLVLLPLTHRAYVHELLRSMRASEALKRVELFEEGFGRSLMSPKGHLAHREGDETSLSEYLHKLTRTLDLEELKEQGVSCLWLELPEGALEQPQLTAALTALCARLSRQRQRSLLLSTNAELPQQLKAWSVEVELSTPRRDEQGLGYLSALLCRAHAPLASQSDREQRRVAERLMTRVQGLDAPGLCLATREASERVAREGARDLTSWEEGMMSALLKAKTSHLRRAVGLELQPLEGFSSLALAGMERYKRYLDYMSALFHHSAERERLRLEAPKGVLLVGLPGCGKSLAAKLTASQLNLPLLRLELDAVMGRYLGESERNLSLALETAEAAAPCVLWIDELDKALGGLSGEEGGGTGKRLLGRLLTWMQEQRGGVYLFATANRVAHLPPELLRRGRFDELWKVTLPSEREREAILKQKLSERAQRWSSEALKEATKLTEGYTGADLEALLREAQVRSFCAARDEVTLDDLKATQAHFTPLSLQFKAQISEEQRRLEEHGFRDVSGDEQLPPPVAIERRALSSSDLEHLLALKRPLRFHFGEQASEGITAHFDVEGLCWVMQGWLEREVDMPSTAQLLKAALHPQGGLQVGPFRMISEGGHLIMSTTAGLRAREAQRFELGPAFRVGDRVESRVGSVVFYERVIPGVDGGEPFLMMETQVTQALWEAVMGSNPSHFKGAKRPVEQVSWEDSVKFANALSRKLDLTPVFEGSDNNARFVEGADGFRLPFDAEWAWAAKGGQGFKYAGSDNLSEVGWYDGNSNLETHDVATLKPNGYGVYDMSGNVLERCLDNYNSQGQYHPGAALRVGRGGSWNDFDSCCTVAGRYSVSPGSRSYCLGFRLSRSLGS